MGRSPERALTVAIAGLGAIGLPVARRLSAGISGLALAAVTARDRSAAEAKLKAAGIAAPVVGLGVLANRADIIVECLPASAFRLIAEPAIAAGRIFMPLSAGALLDHFDLVERAEACGARIIVPTGALLGLDAVRAAAESDAPLDQVRGACEAARRLARHQPHRADLEGTAREGARGFPANVNVAAAL